MLLGNRELAIEVLKKSTTFFTDGTFSVTPSHVDALQVRSSQVLNVLADYQGTSVPVFTVVMSCRRYKLYEGVFQQIKDLFPEFRELMADWEAALRRSINLAGETRNDPSPRRTRATSRLARHNGTMAQWHQGDPTVEDGTSEAGGAQTAPRGSQQRRPYKRLRVDSSESSSDDDY